MSRRSGWIQALQEMLRDGLAVPDAELREDDPGSSCQPVKIHRSGRNLVLSFNAKIPFTARGEPVCIKDRLVPMFREQEGVARMCDYWIFCEKGDEDPTLYVLLCELKSGKPLGGLGQLENARLLAEHVLAMVGHHREIGMERIEYRGIIFCNHRAAPKAGLRPGKLPYAPRGRLQIPVAVLSDRGEYHVAALCT
jgi:hypothetical protein